MPKIKIKLLHPDAQIPYRGSEQAAGYDLSALKKTSIDPKESLLIQTGIALEIPLGFFLLIVPRSSLALKKHLRMPNSIGIIDSDYRGELFIPLYNNHNHLPAIIEKQERIAQAILKKYNTMDFEMVESLSQTQRGTGKFGSSGKY